MILRRFRRFQTLQALRSTEKSVPESASYFSSKRRRHVEERTDECSEGPLSVIPFQSFVILMNAYRAHLLSMNSGFEHVVTET
ncbi:hypothetical protein [Labrenzia sp. THAF82]|uniref:hypothetical protein n=1 Tax=Labrenzia sp. THAF82 TaxID=2587861 RepID=UPI001268813E|nr:hypothetical protein [Labrenzia sp. THAF82]